MCVRRSQGGPTRPRIDVSVATVLPLTLFFGGFRRKETARDGTGFLETIRADWAKIASRMVLRDQRTNRFESRRGHLKAPAADGCGGFVFKRLHRSPLGRGHRMTIPLVGGRIRMDRRSRPCRRADGTAEATLLCCLTRTAPARSPRELLPSLCTSCSELATRRRIECRSARTPRAS